MRSHEITLFLDLGGGDSAVPIGGTPVPVVFLSLHSAAIVSVYCWPTMNSEAAFARIFLVRDGLPKAHDCCPHPRRGDGEWCWGLDRVPHSCAMPSTWRFMARAEIALEAIAWAPFWAIPLPPAELWATNIPWAAQARSSGRSSGQGVGQ